MRGAVAEPRIARWSPAELRPIREHMVALLPEAQEQARETVTSVLVSVACRASEIDPIELFSASADGVRSYWEQPSRGLSIVGLGAAVRAEGHGRARFEQLRAAWQPLVDGAVVHSGGCPISLPLATCGFAFDPERPSSRAWRRFPDADLVVPKLAHMTTREGAWLIGNLLVKPDDAREALVRGVDEALTGGAGASRCGCGPMTGTRPATAIHVNGRTQWAAMVQSARSAIGLGQLDKVVLAREVRLRAEVDFTPGPALRRLRARYDRCTLFATAREGECFLGATPEELVRLTGSRVEVSCLAGSRRRGPDSESDAVEGMSLLADPKERHEHALVVDALRARLDGVCTELRCASRPSLLRMPNVQHLHTRASGVLRRERSLLDLVELLHPTPATAGAPSEAALALIRGTEGFRRGWYAGAVGWLGPSGGEAVVAIRSALLRGPEAVLYAGCGIVADSEPSQEYRESCLKLEPMLWALGGR